MAMAVLCIGKDMVVQMGMRNNVRMGYAAMRVRENMLMHVRM